MLFFVTIIIIIMTSICLTGPLFRDDHKLGVVPERSPPPGKCLWELLEWDF